jgi:hypothetical protein
MPTVCAEFDQHCFKSKCNALWNQIKQRSIAACVLRFIRVDLCHLWSTLRFNSAEPKVQQRNEATTINGQCKECDCFDALNPSHANDRHQRMAGKEFPCQLANHRHSAAWLGSAISLLPVTSINARKVKDRLGVSPIMALQNTRCKFCLDRRVSMGQC